MVQHAICEGYAQVEVQLDTEQPFTACEATFWYSGVTEPSLCVLAVPSRNRRLMILTKQLLQL